MNLHALRLFAAVVEHGGFTRAATAVHVSQPAVSKAVRSLERRAAVPLLERGARGVRLTEAGEVLYEHARRIFALERAAEDELRARRGLAGGTLRVGASTTIASYVLPPVLAAFARAHPGVALRVMTANTRAVAAALRAYELDVALVEGPVEEPGIEATPWREDELVVIASPGHPLASRGRVEVGELAEERLLMRERGSGTRAVAEAALRAQALEPREVLELGGTEAIKEAVAAGLGIAIVSRAALADELALGRIAVLRVPELRIVRALSRLGVRGRVLGTAATVFEEMLAG